MAVAHKRKKLAPATELEVITKSRRRCCICFAVNHDCATKKGQIAHVDHDRTNDAPDNLAWLCLHHHDEYDSTTSQTKGFTAAEVREYRGRLYRWMEQMDASIAAEKATVKALQNAVAAPQKAVLRPRKTTPPPKMVVMPPATLAQRKTGPLPVLDRPLAGLRVLLVEPHALSRVLLAHILRECGCIVHSEVDVDHALQVLDGYDFNILITELYSAFWNDRGTDLVRAIRKKKYDMICVACTGYGDSDSRVEAKEAGFEYFITKPISASQLLESLATVKRAIPEVRLGDNLRRQAKEVEPPPLMYKLR